METFYFLIYNYNKRSAIIGRCHKRNNEDNKFKFYYGSRRDFS